MYQHTITFQVEEGETGHYEFINNIGRAYQTTREISQSIAFNTPNLSTSVALTYIDGRIRVFDPQSTSNPANEKYNKIRMFQVYFDETQESTQNYYPFVSDTVIEL